MELRKSHLAAAVGAALLVGGTAVQAQNLQVQLYGQVNRAMMFADDGHQSKWFNVDGQSSSTRFGITGSAQATPGLRVGARIESEMKSNPSDVVNFGNPSTGTVGAEQQVLFAERWLDLSFAGAWGTVNLGQGSGGADDASTIDLSGTALANGNGVVDWGGGIAMRTAAGGSGGTTVGAAFNQNDFESRYDRLMYTTPVMNGFRAQASYGQKSDAGEAIEASLWWSGKLAGDLQMAVGWSEERLSTSDAIPNNVTIGGSISWLHTSGFNVTFAYTTMEIAAATRDDAEATWIKVGYKWGQHAIALDYLIADNNAANNDEGTSMGIGYVWNPIRWLEVYAGYRVFMLDRTSAGVTTSLEDVTVAQIGSRVRF